MTREELKRYVEDLDEDTRIIVIEANQNANTISTLAERIDTATHILWVLRKIRGGVKRIIKLWIMARALCPEYVPTAPRALWISMDKISYIQTRFDYDFPHTSHDTDYGSVAFMDPYGATHFLPASGLSRADLILSGALPSA